MSRSGTVWDDAKADVFDYFERLRSDAIWRRDISAGCGGRIELNAMGHATLARIFFASSADITPRLITGKSISLIRVRSAKTALA